MNSLKALSVSLPLAATRTFFWVAGGINDGLCVCMYDVVLSCLLLFPRGGVGLLSMSCMLLSFLTLVEDRLEDLPQEGEPAVFGVLG